MINQGRLLTIAGTLVLVLLTANSAIYTVAQQQSDVVVRFGRIVRYHEPPGLHVKVPFVDTVYYVDDRILNLEPDPQQILTRGKRTVILDALVKWRIVDPVKYYLGFRGDESGARRRLGHLVNTGLRDAFGGRPLADVVAATGAQVMGALRDQTDLAAAKYGISVVDARLGRVTLAGADSQAVYQRMAAERTRTAKQLLAQGTEAAEAIRAGADAQREIILADAYRQAQRIRGQGDGRAAAIYAAAYRRYPQFYAFYRSLKAYRDSFNSKKDIMIVDPSAEFFKYMKGPGR